MAFKVFVIDVALESFSNLPTQGFLSVLPFKGVNFSLCVLRIGDGVVSLTLFSQNGEILFFVRDTVHRMVMCNGDIRQYVFHVEKWCGIFDVE